MKALEPWVRLSALGGFALLLLGAIDPLEGSVLILPGSALLALGAFIGKSSQRALLGWALLSVTVGVAVLFALRDKDRRRFSPCPRTSPLWPANSGGWRPALAKPNVSVPPHRREMRLNVLGWELSTPKEPMSVVRREETPGADEVLVEVAGCGVCHTDLGFVYEGVSTRHALPLTLGHEISGRVVAAGAGAESWLGREVVVPAVIPCGRCRACRAGRGSICPQQIFPGNDVHGGFATHVRVPARGLCPVPDLRDPARNPAGIDLASLSVVADAVSTPYQAIERVGLAAGDLAVFVGVGGVGGFGVQLAAAREAHVVAIDVDERRLEEIRAYGAHLTLVAGDVRALKKAVTTFARAHDVPTWRTFVFETSGTVPGQETAFALLGHGGTLSVVGYTPAKAQLRLSNLMALDASAQGNWGCLPEHYPAVVERVLSGAVRVRPFVEHRPLSSINQTFEEIHARQVSRRIVLVPGSQP